MSRVGGKEMKAGAKRKQLRYLEKKKTNASPGEKKYGNQKHNSEHGLSRARRNLSRRKQRQHSVTSAKEKKKSKYPITDGKTGRFGKMAD